MPATSTGSPAASSGPQHRAPRRRPGGGAVLAAGLSAVGAATVVAVLALGGGDDGAATPPGASGSATAAPQGSESTAQDPTRAAALWLAGQAPTAGRVAVDPGLYDEVAGTSSLASRLVPVPLTASAEEGVSAQWLVSGAQVRAAAEGTWAAQALAGSREVVAFGEGDDRVEVRELGDVTELDAPVDGSAADPAASSGPPSPSAARSTATAASEASLRELAANPRLDFSPRAREALRDGPVDLRLAALLAQLAAVVPLSVSDVPAGGSAGEPARTAVLDGLDGSPVGSDPGALQLLQRQLSAQDPSFRATTSQEQDGSTTVLRLVVPPVTG